MSKKAEWVAVICRYFICLLMLVYGLVKVFQGQFYADDYWKDMSLKQLSGIQLTWAFYSYSPAYETILGITEVTIGLLVFFKRTTKLGVILFLPVILNILFVNLVFNIGALASVVPLFIAGVILFIINFKSYKIYFFNDTINTGDVRNAFRKIIPKVILITMGCSLAALIIYNNKFRIKQDPEMKGAWILSGHQDIERIYFEKGSKCVFRTIKGGLIFATYKTTPHKTITITEDSAGMLNWKNQPYFIRKDSLYVTANNKSQSLIRVR